MVQLSKARWYDHVRFVFSSLLLLFALIVTSYSIVTQKTQFWTQVPGWAALLIFIVCLFWLGVVEGLQIALVELKRQHPDTYKSSHPRAYNLGQRAGRGDNTERFLMGRQVFVVLLVFFAAKLTTIHSEPDDFLFPVPEWFQVSLLETGFLSCVVVVIIAQLMPQIVAAMYPVHFLNLWLMYPAYWICIGVELTGLTHACWLLSWLFKRAMCIKEEPASLEDVTAEIEAVADHLLHNENGSTCKSVKVVAKSVEANVHPDTLTIIRQYLDSHPEKFAAYPSVVGGNSYPSPQEMAQEFTKKGLAVPPFLSSINDPNHIPPHVVAMQLMTKLDKRGCICTKSEQIA